MLGGRQAFRDSLGLWRSTGYAALSFFFESCWEEFILLESRVDYSHCWVYSTYGMVKYNLGGASSVAYGIAPIGLLSQTCFLFSA